MKSNKIFFLLSVSLRWLAVIKQPESENEKLEFNWPIGGGGGTKNKRTVSPTERQDFLPPKSGGCPGYDTFGDLRSVEYPFIAITPMSTLIQRNSTR